MSSGVFVRTLAVSSLVINEIMYRPRGDSQYEEWIEVYNPAEAVDLAGWQLTSDNNEGNPDTIMGDPELGTGSSLLPSGGYAVITPQNAAIDTELLSNPGFENNSSWTRSGGWRRIKDGDTHEGQRKLSQTYLGWVYQTVAIPATASSVRFNCWEKTPAAPASTRLVITVRAMDFTVLETLYDGSMGADWTLHTADLTAYAGQTVNIDFENMNITTCWIDDISVSWSQIPSSTLRLQVDDTTLAGKLNNKTDTITLLSAGTVIDAVTYQRSWGGNNNDRTLERIRTSGDSMDASNWTEGPVNGTPGQINQANLP
jgi:hypothetical protein